MPGYIKKSLYKLQHYSPLCKYNSPNQWRRPQYGTIIKYAPDDDITSELGKDEKTKVQHIFLTLLYYAQTLDCTMLTSLKTILEQRFNLQDAQPRPSLSSSIVQQQIQILLLDTKQVTW